MNAADTREPTLMTEDELLKYLERLDGQPGSPRERQHASPELARPGDCGSARGDISSASVDVHHGHSVQTFCRSSSDEHLPSRPSSATATKGLNDWVRRTPQTSPTARNSAQVWLRQQERLVAVPAATPNAVGQAPLPAVGDLSQRDVKSALEVKPPPLSWQSSREKAISEQLCQLDTVVRKLSKDGGSALKATLDSQEPGTLSEDEFFRYLQLLEAPSDIDVQPQPSLPAKPLRRERASASSESSRKKSTTNVGPPRPPAISLQGSRDKGMTKMEPPTLSPESSDEKAAVIGEQIRQLDTVVHKLAQDGSTLKATLDSQPPSPTLTEDEFSKYVQRLEIAHITAQEHDSVLNRLAFRLFRIEERKRLEENEEDAAEIQICREEDGDERAEQVIQSIVNTEWQQLDSAERAVYIEAARRDLNRIGYRR